MVSKTTWIAENIWNSFEETTVYLKFELPLISQTKSNGLAQEEQMKKPKDALNSTNLSNSQSWWEKNPIDNKKYLNHICLIESR